MLPSQSAVRGGANDDSESRSVLYDLAVVNNWKEGPHYLVYVRDWQAETASYVLFNDLDGYPVRKPPSVGFDEVRIDIASLSRCHTDHLL